MLSTVYGSLRRPAKASLESRMHMRLIVWIFHRIIYALLVIFLLSFWGRVVKLADTTASKAVGFTSVGVRVPPRPFSKVFTYPNKPLKDIRTAFKNASKRAGIKNLRFHDLRDTFATRLVLDGVDPATVSKLLGALFYSDDYAMLILYLKPLNRLFLS